MIYREVFHEYELLAAKADRAFDEVKKDFAGCIKCTLGCSDCCHAVFGIFPVEAAYLKYHFDRLDRGVRREALTRSRKAAAELEKIEQEMQAAPDSGAREEILSRARVRCPLLDEEEKCILYRQRPLTCRVYGIPSISGGRPRVCWKAGFQKGKTYPVFNLDAVYRELYKLSRKLLGRAGQNDLEKASLLVSLPVVLQSAVGDLASGNWQ